MSTCFCDGLIKDLRLILNYNSFIDAHIHDLHEIEFLLIQLKAIAHNISFLLLTFRTPFFCCLARLETLMEHATVKVN